LTKKCPEDYTQCKYYHPEQNVESRCIIGSKLECCIKELRVWIKMNKELSNKLKKLGGIAQG